MPDDKHEHENGQGGISGLLEQLPTERLMDQTRDLLSAAGERALSAAGDKVGDLTERLLDYVENGPVAKGDGDGGGGGGPSPMRVMLGAGAAGVKQMITNKLTGGGGGKRGGGKKLKLTNIVEQTDVGVPVRVAYNQWTQFQDFPKYTKRVETVDQQSEQKMTWKAGIFLSHRTWEATVVEQVPDETIVWRSKGQKGHVDGAVTFHELAPNLTRILVVLEYHPQGLFEKTGNIWRAQGRRARLELKHFRRHVMTHTILDQEGVEGWRGEIRDGKVVKSHEDALKEEEEARDEQGAEDEGEEFEGDELDGDDTYEDEGGDEDSYDDQEDRDQEDRDDRGEGDEEAFDDEYDDERPEDEWDEDEPEADEEDEEEPDDEYEDDGAAYDEDEDESRDDDEFADEDDESEDEPAPRSRRRAPARSR